MRISELAATTGVSIATLKFYVREGLLPRGTATSSTQAVYDERHVERVQLIAALSNVRDLPLARIRDILDIVDDPSADLVEATGTAVAALPPYVDEQPLDLEAARHVIEALGLSYDPAYAATAQLQLALDGLEAAGMRTSAEALVQYAEPLRAIAKGELQPMFDMSRAEAVSYAVLGTALHEPLILALRRLMHHHLLVTAAEQA